MTLIEREAGKYKTARVEKELDFTLSEDDADEFRTSSQLTRFVNCT